MSDNKEAKNATSQGTDEKFPRKAVRCPTGSTDQETARNLAMLVTSPELAAYRVVNAAEYKSVFGEHIDAPTLVAQLRDQAAEVKGGSLARAEAMLMTQATALQSLFSRLAERGMGCDEVVPFEANMRMAPRAQSQCRATLETLAAIKNPPVLFAKQANVTTGPQQINNGMAAPSRPRENEIKPNKLLEANNGERMDPGTQGATGRANPEVEAVAAVYGAKVSGRCRQGLERAVF